MFKMIENAIKAFISMFAREEKKIAVQTAKMQDVNTEIKTVQEVAEELKEKEVPDYPVTFATAPTAPTTPVVPVTVYATDDGVTAEIANNTGDVSRTVRYSVGGDGDNLEVIQSNQRATSSITMSHNKDENILTMEKITTKKTSNKELTEIRRDSIYEDGKETVDIMEYYDKNASYYKENAVSEFNMEDVSIVSTNSLINESYASKEHTFESNEIREKYDDGSFYYSLNTRDTLSTRTKTQEETHYIEESIDDLGYRKFEEIANYEETSAKRVEHKESSEIISDFEESTVTNRNETQHYTWTRSKETNNFSATETVEGENYYFSSTQENNQVTTSSKTTNHSSYSSYTNNDGIVTTKDWHQEETKTKTKNVFTFESSNSYEDEDTFIYNVENYSIESTSKKSVETWYIDDLEVNSKYYRDYNEEIEKITYADGRYSYSNHRSVDFSADDFSFWIEIYDESTKYGKMSSINSYYDGNEESVYYDLYQQEIISLSSNSAETKKTIA